MILLFDESHVPCIAECGLLSVTRIIAVHSGTEVCHECCVDDGVTQDTYKLPPEVTDDDQQLFSLAVQVR